MTNDNCLDYLKLAEKIQAEKLDRKSLEFINDNFDTLKEKIDSLGSEVNFYKINFYKNYFVFNAVYSN